LPGVDEALRRLDEAMALLEQLERGVGRLAEEREEGVSRGTIYRLYANMVRLHEKLAELRAILFELGSRCDS